MNQKEKWIEDTMDASQVVGRAVPSEALMQRLKAIPSTVKTGYDLVPKKMVWAVAASIAILICINIFSMSKYETTTPETISQTETNSNHFSYLKHI